MSRPALIFVDIDIKSGFELDGEVVVVDGDLLDELSDKACIPTNSVPK